jgi:hypothetical protein
MNKGVWSLFLQSSATFQIDQPASRPMASPPCFQDRIQSSAARIWAFLSFLKIYSIKLTEARSRSGESIYTMRTAIFIARRPRRTSQKGPSWICPSLPQNVEERAGERRFLCRKAWAFILRFSAWSAGKQLPRFPSGAIKCLHIAILTETRKSLHVPGTGFFERLRP